MLAAMTWPLVVLSAVCLAGCATVANGPHGQDLAANGQPSAAAAQAAKLKVSAREVVEMASRYFGEIEFVFENPTPEWVRIEKVGLDFGSAAFNQMVYLPWGAQLESWSEATHQRNLIREANDAMAIELLGLGAAVAAAASPSPHAVAFAGGLASLAAAGALGAAVAGQAATTEGGPVFAGRHLLALPIEVPPGLFARRFVVINTPNDQGLGCFSRVILTYELADKSSHKVAVDFRSGADWQERPAWQANACPRRER
jgi:hypothetical protein